VQHLDLELRVLHQADATAPTGAPSPTPTTATRRRNIDNPAGLAGRGSDSTAGLT
jgi:hypothetical protein